MSNTHSQFMQLAIDEAWKYQFLTYPNPAVGATVVLNHKVLSVQAHKKAGQPHAEVLALKDAYLTKHKKSPLKDIFDSYKIHDFLIKNHNNFFNECEIYVTLEPCNHQGKTPACATLLASLNLKKIYIGTLDPNEEASGGKKRLLDANIEVITGVNKEKTDQLLYPFKKWQKDRFVFFKQAMREDGSVNGGYITTKDSLTLVHEIRTKIDLMVIGGETVRDDKPTLDSRYARNNEAPDILIYSNTNNFDKKIPLFEVKNRVVEISNKLDLLENKNFVMIEGGKKLIKDLYKFCDYLMIFLSHKVSFNRKFDINSLGYTKVYSYMINKYDEIIFLKKNLER